MDIPSATPVPAAGNEIDRPVPSEPSARVWGSDAIAAMLRELDIPYVALNPGSSYRGLHDSLVNYLGNTRPRMLLCLMHATMAIFNAWCDRVPLIVLGATGAVDAVRRRPWIEWIHTVRDQGALIRNYTKWDDQPASIGAAQEAILRANMIAPSRHSQRRTLSLPSSLLRNGSWRYSMKPRETSIKPGRTFSATSN